MNDLLFLKACLESDALRKMIQLYALAIFVAFSCNFFFSEGKTWGTGRPLVFASYSRTCCLFSRRKSSLQYSSSVCRKYLYLGCETNLNSLRGMCLSSSTDSSFIDFATVSVTHEKKFNVKINRLHKSRNFLSVIWEIVYLPIDSSRLNVV